MMNITPLEEVSLSSQATVCALNEKSYCFKLFMLLSIYDCSAVTVRPEMMMSGFLSSLSRSACDSRPPTLRQPALSTYGDNFLNWLFVGISFPNRIHAKTSGKALYWRLRMTTLLAFARSPGQGLLHVCQPSQLPLLFPRLKVLAMWISLAIVLISDLQDEKDSKRLGSKGESTT